MATPQQNRFRKLKPGQMLGDSSADNIPVGLSPKLVAAGQSAGGITLERAAQLPRPRSVIENPQQKTFGGKAMSLLGDLDSVVSNQTPKTIIDPITNRAVVPVKDATVNNAPNTVAAMTGTAAQPGLMGPTDLTVGSGMVPKTFVVGQGGTNPILGGALVSTPTANKVYSPEEILAIRNSTPAVGLAQRPPTTAEAMRFTGRNTNLTTDANDVARKNFMADSLERGKAWLADQANDPNSKTNRFLTPRINGVAGAKLGLAQQQIESSRDVARYAADKSYAYAETAARERAMDRGVKMFGIQATAEGRAAQAKATKDAADTAAQTKQAEQISLLAQAYAGATTDAERAQALAGLAPYGVTADKDGNLVMPAEKTESPKAGDTRVVNGITYVRDADGLWTPQAKNRSFTWPF